MIFKKISMEHARFSTETIVDIQELLNLSYKEPSGPCGDVQKSFIIDNDAIL
jgi:hypothetical protein